MKYFIPMSGKYMKYFIALSYKFVCCVLSQADDAAGLRETESKLKFLLDCSSAFQRQSFSQRKHIQPKRNLGKNKLILSALLEFLPALYSGENLSTEIQFLTAMISQRKIFLAVWKRIFNNQYFGYYTCCFVPHFCKVEDVLWQTFLGIFSFLLFCCLLGCLLLPSPPQPVKRNGGGVGNLDQVQPDYTQCPHTGHKFGYIQDKNQHHRV